MLTLHSLPKAHGKKRKRYGRGNASKGNYSGRGLKGQRSRSGGRSGLKLRGLKQSIMALPKTRGFRSLAGASQVVSLKQLEKHFENGAVVDSAALLAKGLIQTLEAPVKILSTGKLKKALTVRVHAASKTAQEAITTAKGSFEAVLHPTKKAIKSRGKKKTVSTKK